MNHININQDNRITEYSTNNILESLYKLFSGTDIPTDINEIILDNTSELEGNITVQGIYEYQYNWLLEQLPKLRINYTNLYFYVKDPYIKAKLLENNFGDNNGHLLCDRVFAATSLPNFGIIQGYAEYETNITEFNELAEFTNVTSLEKNFRMCKNLVSVDLKNITNLINTVFYRSGIKYCYNSNKVEVISGQCFEDCSRLEEFDFSSVREIGWNAFNGCSSLTEIHFNSNIDINFAQSCFYNCASLRVVDGLDSQTRLTHQLFSNCSKLEQISIPNVIETDITTFQDCTSLHTVYAPKLKTMGDSTFRNCNKLSNLTIDWEHITELKKWVFQYCKIETADISNVISLNDAVFQYCDKLTTVGELNSELKIISNYCFGDCKLLEEIDLSNIEQLCDHCFLNCSSLSNIGCDLSNITHLPGRNHFYGCTSLRCQINLTNYEDSIINEGTFKFTDITSFTGSQNITVLNGSVFEECRSLTSFNCPNIITLVGWTFKKCTSLTSLNLPNLINIGRESFLDCISLTSIGNCKPVNIDINAFRNTKVNVDLSECTSLGESAFQNNSGIGPNIDLSNVITMNNSVFSNTPNLSQVKWSNTLTEIPNYSFKESGITTITNISSVTKIGFQSFLYCISLTTIDLSSVEIIDENGLGDCRSLSSIGNTSNLKTLGNSNFNNALITTINLENVETIGSNCFYNCYNLVGPLIMNKITSLGKDLFMNCSNISYLVINVNTLPTKSNQAFGNYGRTFPIYIKDELYDAALAAWSSTENALSSRLRKLSTL